MSKCKFKVGDIVIGNHPNHYTWTTKGWIGEVTKVDVSGVFSAKGKCELFTEPIVFDDLNPQYFDLYTKNQPEKIVITTDGKTTTAKMYRDKSVVKVETTKCHPDDRFNFMVGARIAFNRLVGTPTGEEKKETPKGTLNIQIGKKYKIKDYDKVRDHCSKTRHTWDEIQKAGAVTVKRWCGDGYYECDTGYKGVWHFPPEAFECEWEEPKYYNGKVVCVYNTGNEIAYTKGKIYQMVDGQLIDDRETIFPSKTKKVKSFKEWCEWSTAKWLEVVE